jgi:hypothetical protein
LFVFSPIFFDPKFGLASFWLDTAPSFMMLSSMISIYNWNKTNNNKWLLFAGFCISIAIMSRYVFCIWTLVIIGPQFLYYLYKKNSTFIFRYLKPILLLLSASLISLPFLLYNFYNFYQYYFNGPTYGVGGTIINSIVRLMNNNFGIYYLILLLSVLFFIRVKSVEFIQIERLKNWDKYFSNLIFLNSIDVQISNSFEYSTINGHMFYIVCRSIEERTELISYLKDNGIHAVFHYLCLHESDFYLEGIQKEELKNAKKFENCLLILPFWIGLITNQIDFNCDKIRSFYFEK